jgi:gluconolactonase
MQQHPSSACKVFLLAAIAAPAGTASKAHAAGTTLQVPGAEVFRFDKALDAPIEPGPQIEEVASGFKFAEGPMWAKAHSGSPM